MTNTVLYAVNATTNVTRCYRPRTILSTFESSKCPFPLTLSTSKSVYCCYSSRGHHSYTHTERQELRLLSKKKKKTNENSGAGGPYGIPTSPSSSGGPAITLSQATPLRTFGRALEFAGTPTLQSRRARIPQTRSASTSSRSPDTVSTCASCRRGKTYGCPGVSSRLYDGAPRGARLRCTA
jgi:hypothetical protein